MGSATMATTQQTWQEELKFITDFMRELSRQTDPQIAANLYGKRLREGGFFPSDGFLAVSRRDLKSPSYRITRSSSWKEAIDPWKEKDRLPLFTTGLLSELIYANAPAIIDDLPSRYGPDDPAAQYFAGMKFLLAMPQFDDGESTNMSVVMTRDCVGIQREKIPMMIMQSNLWGRAVLSSVLRRELKTAYDALDHELKAVGRIQRSLLPHTLPEIEGLDVAAHYETSQRAGGDYYDFFSLPGNRWGFIIADVSGHGIPAAVRMAITHAIAHTRPELAVPPGEMLGYLNAILETRYIGRTGSFVTALYADYNPATRELRYASAGHPPPRYVRDKKVTPLCLDGGLPLGIDAIVHYPQQSRILQPGDRLLFYTDGVSEAFNFGREQFGTDAMDAALVASDGDASALLARVLAELKLHSGEVPLADDRTLLAICVK
jgi:sigma-B regulation protein RsbU (phosphoserine phosphatase)